MLTAWFIKRANKNSKAQIAFVAANYTQGEQLAQLWPLLLNVTGLGLLFLG